MPVREARICEVCARPYVSSYAGQRFCGRVCSDTRRYGRPPTSHGPLRRVCEVCGAEYRRTYSAQRTCSRACGWSLRQREGKVPRPKPKLPTLEPARNCARCAVSYVRSRGFGSYCSVQHYMDAKREYDRQYNATRRPKSATYGQCLDCGQHVSGQRRKCDGCLERTKRERKRRDKRRRRAMKLGVAHEPYTLAEIAERDRNRCGICRRRVAMAKLVPHPKAPTIDHIVPLADGGADVRSNVQLAHFLCNACKSDGGTQQLMLVG